jgi:hypothetical protein
MALIDVSQVQHENPLEVVERIATTHLWSCERTCEDEVTIVDGCSKQIVFHL